MPVMLRRPVPIGVDDAGFDEEDIGLVPRATTAPVPLGNGLPASALDAEAKPSPKPISSTAVAAPIGMAPVARAPIGNPKLEADQTELGRLQRSGSGIDQITHPVDAQGNPTGQKVGIGKKILGGLARVGDIAGTAFFPGITAQIPGTQLHHDVLENRAAGNVVADLKNEREQAEINNLENPPDAKLENEGKTVETATGVFQWNPQSKRYDIPVGPGKTQPKGLNSPQEGYAQAIADAIGRGADPATDPHVVAWRTAIENLGKEPNQNDFEKYYTSWLKDNKQNDTAANRLRAHKEWEIKPVQPGSGDARMDRSYQFNASALSKLGDPVEQLSGRIGRLKETLAQGSPQADALIAPELLTVMAGGMGSGLRMNEAEISRIVGGRSQWESLQAAVNKWKLDPNAANSITPAQRQQIHALVDAVDRKLNLKRQVIENANQDLISSQDVTSHRRVVADVRKRLADIDAGTYTGEQSGGGHVIEVGGKRYRYKGSGDTADLKNYDEVKGGK